MQESGQQVIVTLPDPRDISDRHSPFNISPTTNNEVQSGSNQVHIPDNGISNLDNAMDDMYETREEEQVRLTRQVQQLPAPNEQSEEIQDQPRIDAGSLHDISTHLQEDNLNGLQDQAPATSNNHNQEIDNTEDIEASLENLKLIQEFNAALRTATLDNGPLPQEIIHRLRNPRQGIYSLQDDPALQTGLEFFIGTSSASEQVYNNVRDTHHRSLAQLGIEDVEIPSLYQIKRQIEDITGVCSMKHDMCINTCIAYTGPLAQLEQCPKCREPRYDQQLLARTQVKKPQHQFNTIPLGPQLQALWSSPESAKDLRYRREKTEEVLREARENNGEIKRYDDIFSGSAYLEAHSSGKIQPNDTVLMLSIDGAQLYQSKKSDCWIYIWVVLDLGPDKCYRKKHVLPGGFIPGPNHPKLIDLFLFPGFHHLIALMKEGLQVWDALDNAVIQSHPFALLGTADGPGLVCINGMTGHRGAYGCRLNCPLKGRCRQGKKHYYPALLKPVGNPVPGCDHPDVDPSHLRIGTPEEYLTTLNYVLSAQNPTQYRNYRRETGIVNSSIFSALPRDHTLPVPECFSEDLMHLPALNITDLMLGLWRGTQDCEAPDDRSTWDWQVLVGETWQTHGRRVANATPHLPGSFDRPPRNPTEKISSGYKAMEFLTYFYGLGPGLFHGILPDKYWKNYCKLVAGIRLISQRIITKADVIQSHHLLVSFVLEFENLYYQRMPSRLSFCHQSIHALLHIAPKITRMGPGICYAQWVMERTIGNLGEEIRQPSNPFQNLAQRGVRRAQVNALTALMPSFDPPPPLPSVSKELGDGYVLLGSRERYAHAIPEDELDCLKQFYSNQGIELDNTWRTPIQKWARLRLPNDQIARSAWKEKGRPLQNVRISRNVMYQRDNQAEWLFGEIQYFFQLILNREEITVALISQYSEPDSDLQKESSGTLLVCNYQKRTALQIIPVKQIRSCVAMIPFNDPPDDQYFVCPKMGMEMARLAGIGEEDTGDI